MYEKQPSTFLILWITLVLLCQEAESGPTKRLSRMVREVYPEIEPENDGNQAQVCIVGDVVYGTEEAVPAEQPCLKCRCQPPGVQCETIQCAKRPGCKAIHKPNKCCPDYQCECEHNGKFYANGEKLETPPGGECKVCYCRGGEVQCAEVSCYIRKDCEGKRVPGTCCPKYDHCPPIDSIPDRPPYTTEIIPPNSNKDHFESWSITGAPPNFLEIIMSPTSNSLQDENKILDTNSHEVSTSSYKHLEVEDLQKDAAAATVPKITIQEIIPERKEIPVTASPRVEVEPPRGTLIIEEAKDFANDSNNDLVVTDADADSSEISEIFQQPPPVLRIGDKLLFLKKGEFVHERGTSTPSSVITIIGAEGLQRGFEDSAEIHEIKIENDTKNDVEDEAGTLESIDTHDLNLLVLNTAASTHILSLVKRKNKPIQSTTTVETVNSEAVPDTTSPVPDLVVANETVSSSTTENADVPITTSNPIDSLTTEGTANVTYLLSTEKSFSTSTKSDEIIPEQNPAYPPLPEIMIQNMDDTSQRFDTENIERESGNTSTMLPDAKILPVVLDIRSNATVPKNITNSEWLKTNTDTLVNYKAVLPHNLLKARAPTDYEDITDNTTVSSDNPVIDVAASLTTIDSSLNDTARSIENVANSKEDSGEMTTPKNSHAPILINENASVENKNDDASDEANDMVNDVKESPDDGRVEKTTIRNVQLIDNDHEMGKNQTSVKNTDVEIIDAVTIRKREKSVSSTDTAEKIDDETPLKIIKRENSADDQSQIFMDLEKDLTNQNESSLSSDEEHADDDAIFKELLEDTSTTKPRKDSSTNSGDKDSRTLERVNTALQQFSNGGETPDADILGILSNFFNNRYKQ